MDGDSLNAQIQAVGDKIRALKLSKASKDDLQPEIDSLLSLKAKFKEATGKDWVPAGGGAAPRSQPKSAPKEKKAPAPPPPVKEDGKKQTRLCLEAKKEENLSDWYSQVSQSVSQLIGD